MNALFRPAADLVDEDLWIETTQTLAATAGLWTVLDISRREPKAWTPHFVFCGGEGVGKTSLVNRFMRAARRNVSCAVLARATDDMREKLQGRTVTEMHAAWVEDRLRDHGGCPMICSPAHWVPETVVARAVESVKNEHPSAMVTMAARPDRSASMGSWIWRSQGNREHDPVRRTSLVFVDESDRLLNLSVPKRRVYLDEIQSFERQIGHRVVPVLIGSPDLAAAVREIGATQVIRLDAMPNGAEFADVASMVFGTRDPDEVAVLHRASGGSMGPLLHMARMKGLRAPFNIPDDQIKKLPGPDPRQGRS